MAREESPLEVAAQAWTFSALSSMLKALIKAASQNMPAIWRGQGKVLCQPQTTTTAVRNCMPRRQGQGKDQEQAGEEPTEKLAEKVSEGIFEQPLEEDTRQVAGQAIHWGYGTFWGVVYGIVQSSLRLPHLMHGTLFGSLIALVAATVVPAMRVVPPPEEQPASQRVMMTTINLIYGWVVALTFAFLSRDAG